MTCAFDVDFFLELEDIDIDIIDEAPKEASMGYTFVTDQLAQGGAPPPDSSVPFDVLVLTAAEWQPILPNGPAKIIRVTLGDSIPSREDIRRAILASRQIADALRRGECVLTTCFQGRNRSGFVNGLALIELGWSSLDAIEAIRHARGANALSNAHFRSVLHDYARTLGRSSSAALG